MELLNPWAWLLLLAVIPVVAFFFLKTRPREKTITTSLFWDEIVEERRFRSFGYRFRYPAALILSLIFIMLLVAAALDPVVSSRKNATGTVVVFDNSASMNAMDKRKKTRFEIARAELLGAISRQESGRNTAIITAAGEPEIAIGFTDHRPTLRETVAGLRHTDAPASLSGAVELAKVLTRNLEDSRIFVFTDGCSPETDDLIRDNSVTVFRIGESLDNVALTRFQARRSMNDAIGFEVFANVANFGEKSVRLNLSLELHVDETNHGESVVETVDLIPISLEPGATEMIVARGYAEQGGIVVGSLFADTETGIEFRDALKADNTARAILPPKTKQSILFFGEEDFFLRKVLESQANVEIATITECPKTVDTDSLLVIHATVPETIPPGNVLVVDPKNDCDLFSVGKPIESPIIGQVENDSPLLKFVRLENVVVPGARRLDFRETNAMKTLLATPENEPILVQLDSKEKNPGKILILSADLKQGDLALRTAFPILFSNAMSRFRKGGGEMQREAKTGEPFKLALTDREKPENTPSGSIRLRRPDGTEGNVATETDKDGQTFVYVGVPDRSGLWEIVSDSGDRIACFACNINDPRESDLRKNPNGGTIEPFSNKQPAAVSRPIRFWLVGAAIILLLLDWFLYHRRWVE